jgi:K+-sensing histidine kinase KdpD
MTAAATVVAVGFDTKVTIPNLSLVFVVLMIVAGDSLGLDPSLCSAILGAFTFNFSYGTHLPSTTRRTSGRSERDAPAVLTIFIHQRKKDFFNMG